MNYRAADERRLWIRQYADRALEHWRRWASPFGVAPDYVRHLEKDLARCYDQPLVKGFIERTY
jgi:hypothetical protein